MQYALFQPIPGVNPTPEGREGSSIACQRGETLEGSWNCTRTHCSDFWSRVDIEVTHVMMTGDPQQ